MNSLLSNMLQAVHTGNSAWPETADEEAVPVQDIPIMWLFPECYHQQPGPKRRRYKAPLAATAQTHVH